MLCMAQGILGTYKKRHEKSQFVMRTVICETEAILNDRPITHMSSDMNTSSTPPAQDTEIDDADFTLETQFINKHAELIACLIKGTLSRYWQQRRPNVGPWFKFIKM